MGPKILLKGAEEHKNKHQCDVNLSSELLTLLPSGSLTILHHLCHTTLNGTLFIKETVKLRHSTKLERQLK